MASLPFLDFTLDLYTQSLASFLREERRLYGGDAVLTELTQWTGESKEFYDSRKDQAGYLPLPKTHASTLTGHLSGQTPMPNFAELGEVRERSERTGAPSKAELLWWNIDGIGQDGNEMMPWFDGVQERAIATGYRWILVEKPSRAFLASLRLTNRRDDGAKLGGDEVAQGFRPYPVEYPPSAVPFWQYTNGRLDCAIIRIAITPTNLLDDTSSDLGYYLLVRKGFSGLGADYEAGGWWKFDSDQNQLDTGTWDDTQGQIPMFQFIGEPSPGTPERPAIARSLTMELGQIAVGLMNRRSERDWNIMQAAKSVNWILGIPAGEHAQVLAQQDLGSITIGVPPVMRADGSVGIPTIWNSSAALMDSQAFQSVIESGLNEAREIMVKQVTSTPESSGESKKAGFAEATSPLLARLAATRQQAMNTFLYFASLRFGIANPTANVEIPREFDLEPVVDVIDNALARLKRSWLRSPTWERELLLRAGDEDGTLPDDVTLRNKIEAELEESGVVETEPLDALADDEPGTPGRQLPANSADAGGIPASNGRAA